MKRREARTAGWSPALPAVFLEMPGEYLAMAALQVTGLVVAIHPVWRASRPDPVKACVASD